MIEYDKLQYMTVNLLEQIVLCPISRVSGRLVTGIHTPVCAFIRTLLTIGQSNGTVYAVRALIAVLPALFLAQVATAQNTISFPTKDGGVVFADIYGTSDRAVVLAHGGRFNKEGWTRQAERLVAAGFRVLALDFRGYGKSKGPGDSQPMDAPLHVDVLAAVRYLRTNGAKTVSIVGGSMGGGAAGDASIASQPGEINRVVFLGASPNGPAGKLKCASLFIVARDDANADGPRLPRI